MAHFHFSGRLGKKDDTDIRCTFHITPPPALGEVLICSVFADSLFPDGIPRDREGPDMYKGIADSPLERISRACLGKQDEEGKG